MTKPINIFIIYAREDKEIKQGLLSYLNPFVKPYNLNIWHDAHIQPGQEWKYSIDSRLNQTDLFVMLVSIDFMNSHFIHQVEFKYAVERHKANKSIIIPVITRECPWDIDFEFDDYSFSLKELQVLPDEGKPIVDWKTSDHAFNNIATGIRKVVASIKKNQEQQEALEKDQQQIEKAQGEYDKKRIEEEEKQKKIDHEEESFWVLVEEENSIDGYKGYLQKYPNGKHKDVALSVIRTLENINKKRQKDEEEVLWKTSSENNTIDSYRNYLEKTELGFYKEQANKLIPEIEKKNKEILAEKEHQLKEEQDNKLWKESLGANTISAYKKYLNDPKAGLFKEKAEQAIKQLEAEQKEKELEQRLWQKAKTENTINVYNEYLQHYPKGSHRADASNAINSIEKKNQEILAEKERQLKEEQDNKLWKEISGANTIVSYKRYLNETKVGLFKEKAQHALSQLEAEQKEKELEEQLWQKTKTDATLDSYNLYLKKYPNGSYTAAAKTAITNIEEARKQEEAAALKLINNTKEETTKKGKSKKYVFIIGGIVVIAAVVFGIMKMTSNSNSSIREQTVPELKQEENTTTTVNNDEEKKRQDSINAAIAKEKEDSINRRLSVSVGDKYEGGIVVRPASNTVPGLLVTDFDLNAGNKVDWENANKLCEGLIVDQEFKGWSLPTLDELKLIHKARDHISDLIRGDLFWSMTKNKNNGWTKLFRFSDGSTHERNQDMSYNKFFVRAVRKF
jgi:hypothetical protein